MYFLAEKASGHDLAELLPFRYLREFAPEKRLHRTDPLTPSVPGSARVTHLGTHPSTGNGAAGR